MLKARPHLVVGRRPVHGTLPVAACLVVVTGTAVCSNSRPLNRPAQADQAAPGRITIAAPEVRLPLPPRPGPATVLVVRVSDIKNPASDAISLDVALAPCAESGRRFEPEHLASLGIYPASEAGDYAVPVTQAIARLRNRGVTDLKGVCMQARLRLPQGRKPAGPIEVTLAAPEWREEKKQSDDGDAGPP